MRVDINLYSVNKAPAQQWFIDTGSALDEAVSRMSIFTGAPVIVCLFWIGELIGFNDLLLDKIKNIIAFYGYAHISGVPKDFKYNIGIEYE